MEVVIRDNAAEVALLAASWVARLLGEKPTAVLGLPTGQTMVALYAELVRLHREEGLDFSGCTTFNLDEYVGLPAEHPCSYRCYMREHLFDHVNLDPDRTHLPDGMARDIPRHCQEYEERIQAADGLDLVLLGLGRDGHIAFNEPSSSLSSRTRIKVLTPLTRAANRAGFPSEENVPLYVLTMGVGTIMDARRCVLIATGAGKARAVAAMVEGPVTAMLPASALQYHPRCTALVDDAAAAHLSMREYYRAVYALKPDWQL
ncbi:MAG: glucosamine-6-phosphate deaminase [Armatimonadetes bacterium]|nr:glucosamine-6-phosphate deaminase [Armatimonadota bacterium]